LPNVIKIDPYNFELYHFKVGAVFLRQCRSACFSNVIQPLKVSDALTSLDDVKIITEILTDQKLTKLIKNFTQCFRYLFIFTRSQTNGNFIVVSTDTDRLHLCAWVICYKWLCGNVPITQTLSVDVHNIYS